MERFERVIAPANVPKRTPFEAESTGGVAARLAPCTRSVEPRSFQTVGSSRSEKLPRSG
jgi:hypothetical protein